MCPLFFIKFLFFIALQKLYPLKGTLLLSLKENGFKNFLHAMAVLDYLPKVKKGSGTRFCVLFFHKDVPYLILYPWTKFQGHTLLSSWPTERKRGEDGNIKIPISWERKEFFQYNKKHFSVFEGLSFGKKIKVW